MLIGCIVQRVRRSCRRMAMKMNRMSAPHVAHGGNGQGASSGSRRTPLHHGQGSMSRTPSCTTSRTGSASAAQHHANGSRSRGKAIATPEPSSEENGGDSSQGDPTYQSEIPLDDLFDAPPITQTQGESSQVKYLITFKLFSYTLEEGNW